MKSFNTLHFRSLQGRNGYFSKRSTETKVLPQSVSFLDCDYTNDMIRKTKATTSDNNNAMPSEIKKRRRDRYLLDPCIHSSFLKLYFSKVKAKSLTWLLVARVIVVSILLGVVFQKSTIIGSESSKKQTEKHGCRDARLAPPKKPRIIQFLDSNKEKKITTNTTLMYIIPKSQREQLTRQQATDWFYFREEPRSKEEMDRFVSIEPFETEHCKAMYEWQKSSFPTCNIIHEHQIQEYDVVQNTIQKINYGFFRDIWKVQISTADARRRQYVVLKTLRTDKEYDEYNADRHRRDAVALERLTSSPHVVNIYGHCVNSQMTEYSGEGDVYDAVFNPRRGITLSKEDALRIAIQVATGIADMHNLDKDGQAPMAHTDIAPTQFILIDGYYKLNDFNRVRFIRWNNETNMPCPYQVMNNPGEVSPFLK